MKKNLFLQLNLSGEFSCCPLVKRKKTEGKEHLDLKLNYSMNELLLILENNFSNTIFRIILTKP